MTTTEEPRPSRPPSKLLLTIALLAPPFVLFVAPMLSLIARNTSYFEGDFWVGREIFAAAAVLLCAGAVALGLRRFGWAFVALVAYLLIAPATMLHRLLLAAADSIAVTGGVALLVAVVAVVLWRRNARASLGVLAKLAIFCLLVVGISTGAEVVAGLRPPAASARPSAPSESGSADLPNVYHLILDEFQTDMFLAVLDSETERALQGFTFYPEAITSYGRTDMALASMFATSGYAYDIPPLEFIPQAYAGPTSTLRRLEDAGYATTAYLDTGVRWYGGNPPVPNPKFHSDAEGVSFPGSSDLATSLWFYSQTPRRVARAMIPRRHFQQLTGDVLLPDEAAARSVLGFRGFLNDEQEITSDRGRYVLIHLLLPHFPNVTDERCSYTPGKVTKPIEQTQCAVSIITSLVETLRELDRFDSSTVVIQGDHGSRYELDNGELREITTGNFSDEWSTARARSLLLIKPPGAGGSQLERSNAPVTIDDVMPTIFDAAGIEAPFGPERVSLISEPLPDRPVRHYHFYEKDFGKISAGPLHRYEIRDGKATFEREVPIPLGD